MNDALDRYDEVFKAAGREWNVDWRALKAIAAQESGGNPRAVSKAGAQGLMQIMPETAKGLGVTDAFDPEQSIYAGAKYMNEALTAEKDNPQAALLYYHGGPGWRGSFGRESAGYVPAVAAKYQRYAKADTGTMTDAAPAVEDKVAKDDPFTRALQGPAQGSDTAPAASSKAAEPDAFTKALGAPQEETPETYNPIHAGAVRALNALKGVPRTDAEINALIAPTPGTQYGDILPFAQTPEEGKAGTWHWAMPNLARNILQGFATPVSELGTVDPTTGSYGADPNAILAALSIAGPLGLDTGTMAKKFGGPLSFVEAPSAEAVAGVSALDPEVLRRAQLRPTQGGPPASEPSGIPPSSKPTPAPPSSSARPAGAQVTPEGLAVISPEEAAVYRSVAEIQKLREPQPKGIPDRRQLVPDEDPSLVQTEQNAGLSRELKALRNVNPEVQQMEEKVAERHNEARANYLDKVTKSDIDIHQAQVAREANGAANAAAAWANKTAADIQPVVKFANDVLSGPDGKRDVITKHIGAVRDKLYDAAGNPETDPEILYGVRKDINDRLSKEAQRDDPMSQRAAGLLIQMRGVLDNQIEAAAPGFRKYLEQWHADSLPIDQMSVMQKWAPKLFDTKGKMLFSKFQQMMREAVISRRKDMPLNDWQSLTDEQMGQLWDLRDSLRRAASAEELAKAKGSDTVPNAMDVMRQYFNLGGTAVGHGVANLVSPGWGSIALKTGQDILSPLLGAIAGRRQIRRAGELLSPPPQSPLTPP